MKKIYWHYPHLKFWMGGTKFIYDIFSRFEGAEKVLLCNGGNEKIIDKFVGKGISVKRILPIDTNSMIYWLFFPFFLTLECILSYGQIKEADIIVATLFPSNLVCAVCTKIANKKYYYYCYEPFPFLQNQKFINTFPQTKRLFLKILSFLYASLDTWATRNATKILTLNKITQKMIEKTYGKKSIVTLVGVDSKHFTHNASNRIKQIYKKNILVIHSTDYTEMKRTDLAIMAISKLVKKYPNILLLITSTQPNVPEKNKYVDLVKRLGVERNINFLGLVSYSYLPLYYAASLCYLSCSYDEMLGTTSSNLPVKEALACSTPAIRSDITTEDVEDGISGFLVDPRNVVLVAKKIEYLILHPDKAKKMGVEGRKKIVRLYNWDKVAKTILKNIKD